MTLVDQIKDIDEIWKKLISSYGNARILLQNKIASLEKHNGIWKIQGEEKIFLALSSVVNVMSELTAMAKRFKLEEELYYGGCLEKILSLLGNQREKKFVSKCEKSDATKPEEWLRLSDFLQKELIMRERLVLLEKSKKCLGIEMKGASGSGLKNNASKSSHVGTVGKGGAKCHICDGSITKWSPLPVVVMMSLILLVKNSSRWMKMLVVRNFLQKSCVLSVWIQELVFIQIMSALRSLHAPMSHIQSTNGVFMCSFVQCIRASRKIRSY